MYPSTSRFSILFLVLAFLICLFGAAVSGVLMQHHIAARIGSDPLLGAACHPTSAASCDEVLSSKWGSVHFGSARRHATVPTAALGFFFFAGLGSWFLVVGIPTGRRRWLHVLPTLATLGGVAGAIFFEYVMFARIGKYCPLCMATHVAALLVFVLTLLMWIRPRPKGPSHLVGVQGPSQVVGGADEGINKLPQPSPASPVFERQALLGAPRMDSPSWRLVLVALLLTVSTSVMGLAVYAWRLQSGLAAQYFARWREYDKDTRLNQERFLAQPTVNVPVLPNDPVLGPPDAKYTVVIFSDFLCPPCKTLSAELDKRRKELGDQLRIVYKYFPLERQCNTAIPSTLHPAACPAAVSAEAIRLLKGADAFWKVHHALFENQGKFNMEFAIKQAEELGIDREQYVNRVRQTDSYDTILRHVEEARRLGVNSTPTVFLNNRPMRQWNDRHLWTYLLSEETLRLASSRPASAPSSNPHP